MIICPYCEAVNIEGADACQECGAELAGLDLPIPASDVERSLLVDRVENLTSIPPLTVTPDAPLKKVLRLLDQHSVGCAVVVDQQQVIGVFTERDALLRVGAEAARLGEEPISRFMTERPETLQIDAKIAFAVQRMDLGGYRHLPILSPAGRPVGVISVRDILRYLTDKLSA